jgi:hypothetical protein
MALSKSDAPNVRPRKSDSSDPTAKGESVEAIPAKSAKPVVADQQVGLFLVCSHATNAAKSSPSEKRLPEGLGTASKSAPSRLNGHLQPGIYCVMMTGNSVWLVDQDGAVVLRTTAASLDSRGLKGTESTSSPAGAARERDRLRSGETKPVSSSSEDETSSTLDSPLALNWYCVFAALKKEAMNSTGWDKN